jgi:hypothetical protein
MGNNYFLKLQCTNCRVPIFATIAINGNLLQNDPGSQRIRKYSQLKNPARVSGRKKTIGSDEIMKMHHFLKDFNGDFKAYLK